MVPHTIATEVASPTMTALLISASSAFSLVNSSAKFFVVGENTHTGVFDATSGSALIDEAAIQ